MRATVLLGEPVGSPGVQRWHAKGKTNKERKSEGGAAGVRGEKHTTVDSPPITHPHGFQTSVVRRERRRVAVSTRWRGVNGGVNAMKNRASKGCRWAFRFEACLGFASGLGVSGVFAVEAAARGWPSHKIRGAPELKSSSMASAGVSHPEPGEVT